MGASWTRWMWAGLLVAASGCAAPDLAATRPGSPSPAAGDTPTRAGPPASPSPGEQPSATPTPSLTPTASATPHPDAITSETAGQVRQWMVLSGHRGPVWDVALSPDGGQVASASSDYDVRVWAIPPLGAEALPGGELLHLLERHRGWVYTVGYTPDGTRLVSGGRDQTVQVWDVASGEHLFGMRAFGEAFDLAFSPDGERVAVASLYSARGQMWPLEPGAAWTALEGHTTRLRSVAFSPDGEVLATGDEGGTVLLRDPETGEPVESLAESGSDAYGLAFGPGGVLAVGGGDGFIRIYDVQSGQERRAWLAHGGGVWDVAFAPGGEVLASGGGDGLVVLWAVGTGARLASLCGHGAAVRGVDFSRDGTTLASGGDDGQVRLWRVMR